MTTRTATDVVIEALRASNRRPHREWAPREAARIMAVLATEGFQVVPLAEVSRTRTALRACLTAAAECRRWLTPEPAPGQRLQDVQLPSYPTYRQVWDASRNAEIVAMRALEDWPSPAPGALWNQARDEHPGDGPSRSARYVELMIEHGYVLRRGEPGYDEAGLRLPCGWEPGHGVDGAECPVITSADGPGEVTLRWSCGVTVRLQNLPPTWRYDRDWAKGKAHPHLPPRPMPGATS